MMQARFVVVDEHGGGDMHCVYQAETFLHRAASYEVFDGRRDVNEAAPALDLEPQVFGEGFQRAMAGDAPALQFLLPII